MGFSSLRDHKVAKLTGELLFEMIVANIENYLYSRDFWHENHFTQLRFHLEGTSLIYDNQI